MNQYRRSAYAYTQDYKKQLQSMMIEIEGDIADMRCIIFEIEQEAEDESREMTKEEKLDCEEYRHSIEDLEEAQDAIHAIIRELRG